MNVACPVVDYCYGVPWTCTSFFDYFGTALHAGGKGAATGVHCCGLPMFVCMCFLCVLCLLRYPRERQRAGVLWRENVPKSGPVSPSNDFKYAGHMRWKRSSPRTLSCPALCCCFQSCPYAWFRCVEVRVWRQLCGRRLIVSEGAWCSSSMFMFLRWWTPFPFCGFIVPHKFRVKTTKPYFGFPSVG
jgi:hypothetical protein